MEIICKPDLGNGRIEAHTKCPLGEQATRSCNSGKCISKPILLGGAHRAIAGPLCEGTTTSFELVCRRLMAHDRGATLGADLLDPLPSGSWSLDLRQPVEPRCAEALHDDDATIAAGYSAS